MEKKWEIEYLSGMITAIGIKMNEKKNIVIVVKQEEMVTRLEKVIGKAVWVKVIKERKSEKGEARYDRIIVEYTHLQMSKLIYIGKGNELMNSVKAEYEIKTIRELLLISKAFLVGFLHYSAYLYVETDRKERKRVAMKINSRYSESIMKYIADYNETARENIETIVVRKKQALTIKIYKKSKIMETYIKYTENKERHKEIFEKAYKTNKITDMEIIEMETTRQILHGHNVPIKKIRKENVQ